MDILSTGISMEKTIYRVQLKDRIRIRHVMQLFGLSEAMYVVQNVFLTILRHSNMVKEIGTVNC